MRHIPSLTNATKVKAHALRAGLVFIQFLTASLALVLLILALSLKAQAETLRCDAADGLTTPAEAGTGALLHGRRDRGGLR